MADTAEFKQFGPFFDAGVLVSAIQVYHYQPGTTTLKSMWTVRDKSVSAAQPLIGDGNGIATAYGDGLHDIVIQDSASAVIYTFDDVQVGPVQPVEISVHKNGSDQSALSATAWTKLTWGTETFDAAGTFASDRWTPARTGRALVTANAQFNSILSGTSFACGVYVNSALVKQHSKTAHEVTSGAYNIGIAAIVDLTAVTDFIEIYANPGGQVSDVEGDAEKTWFMGGLIA